jgi:hypothetical protein
VKSRCDNPECEKEYDKVKPWQRFCNPKCKSRLRVLEKRDLEYQRAYMSEYQHSPMFKYNVQKQKAKARGIGFHLSFEEWWDFWGDNWESRGAAPESLVMCRYNDIGDYAVGNIYLDTFSNNSKLGCTLQNQQRDKTTGRFISEHS